VLVRADPCPARGLGASPLVCKRVVEKSRVENTYRSLHLIPAIPPKRNNSPVAVAVVESAKSIRENGGGDGPDGGAHIDHW